MTRLSFVPLTPQFSCPAARPGDYNWRRIMIVLIPC